MGRFNRADISDVQRLNLNVNCGESGPLLRFWLCEFPQHPVDLPIRSLVDFAVETIQVGSDSTSTRISPVGLQTAYLLNFRSLLSNICADFVPGNS